MSIQVNVPALAMEEVAPLAVSDAAMLAPEEIFHGKGNIKEEAELTKEERKRRRANQKRRFRRLKDPSTVLVNTKLFLLIPKRRGCLKGSSLVESGRSPIGEAVALAVGTEVVATGARVHWPTLCRGAATAVKH
ncbi:hypothetical protein ZIOFF_006070 [Zingiber officinale]|uniref:Uncharacterized protein n=1 Tax=Zingiber officinale TaxID=94328 RepID=A0A8J5IBY6_ZINOF|nr:hypothetical protein ZIOFF_006070 [Zingiber officinale]